MTASSNGHLDILDLLLSVIELSVHTVGIVNALPEIDWEKE